MFSYFVRALGSKGKSITTVMITLACISVLIAGILLFDALTVKNTVSALEYRDGFSLIPEYADALGVKEGSRYILSSETPVSARELQDSLTVNGGRVLVEKADSGRFIVEPVTPIAPGSLVMFTLESDNKDVHWTFQTAVPFSVLGSLPDNKTTNVPVSTGIEIYFSHEGYDNLDDYFVIEPAVKGRFEYHRSVAVFIPEKLEYGKIYTVTLKKGLPLGGTGHKIESDYTFQFETELENYYDEDESKIQRENLRFYNTYYEFGTSEELFLPVYAYYNAYSRTGNVPRVDSANVTAKIYRYSDVDSFINAAAQNEEAPYWCQNPASMGKLSLDGLEKVAEFTQEIPLQYNRSQDAFVNIPENLGEGYYIIEAVWNKAVAQALIQVTDIAVNVVESTNGNLIWLNSLENSDPSILEGAQIISTDSGFIVARTNKEGIALIDKDTLDSRKTSNGKYGICKAVLKDGRAVVFKITNLVKPDEGYIPYYGSARDDYWSYIQLDRNLFKPDDVVYFQGMVKGRYSEKAVNRVTVEISKTSWFRGYYSEYVMYDSYPAKGVEGEIFQDRIFVPWWIETRPFAKADINCENGFFAGSLKLPQLSPGGYNLTVKYDGVTVDSTMITVEEYVKPSFKIDITSSKKAVFADEMFGVNFKAGFFEGTPLSETELTWSLWDNYSSKYQQETVRTNKEGEFSINYTPAYQTGKQGKQQVLISARARMPEMGEISASDSIWVFLNDVDVQYEAWRENGQGNLKVNLKNIDLTEYNADPAAYWPSRDIYAKDPVVGRSIKGTVYRCTWEKYFVRKEYDFISKQTVDRYEYKLDKQIIDEFSIVTGEDGTAEYTVALPEEENVWYEAEIKVNDNKGREMIFRPWFSSYRYSSAYSPEGSISDIYISPNMFWLDDGTGNPYESKKYDEKSEVSLVFKKGIDRLEGGKYLFIKSQNGIRDYYVSDEGSLSFEFSESDIPNVSITGIWFNGLTCVISNQYSAVYDYSKRNLKVEAHTDRDSYRPGDTVYVTVYARDENDNPVSGGQVAIALVDEALFALQEYEYQVLDALYKRVNSGITRNWSSHYTWDKANNGDGLGGVSRNNGADFAQEEKAWDDMDTGAQAPSAESGKGVREDFRDTAEFKTAVMDENGRAVFEFRIPDNITSWRLTAAAVSGDLKAGNGLASTKVTLPMFINYSMGTTFLEGDIPYVGITAYGTALDSDDIIRFRITSKNHPDKSVVVDGKAFERVNLKLWKLQAGSDDILISAEVLDSKGKNENDEEENLKDAVRQKINVVKSYHLMRKADYGILQAGTKIPGSTSGTTRIIFMDKGKAKYYPTLYSLSWNFGNRIEQKFSSEGARLLLAKLGEENPATSLAAKFEPSEYQRTDGGLAILPYGPSDPYLSALLAGPLKDKVNKESLSRYLYGVYYGNNPDRGVAALFGLASLGESVMLELERVYKDTGRNALHSIYLALAYESLNEKPIALKIFNESIAPAIRNMEPYMMVEAGGNQDEQLRATALAALLASRLDLPEKDALFDYCLHNMTKDILINVEKYLFISNEIPKIAGTKADLEAEVKFSWLGESETVKPSGYGCSMELPSAQLGELTIQAVVGDVGYVSIYEAPWIETGPAPDLSVSRKYSVVGREWDGTLRQGDIVKITLNYSIGEGALDGSYELCDYLPSGLKPIINIWKYGINEYGWGACEISNSRVIFRVGKGWRGIGNDSEGPSYYARVIAPGEYKAEGPSLQSEAARTVFVSGSSEIITIEQ